MNLQEQIQQAIGIKSDDEIERSIITALAEAGKTTRGREWYTPTAISVHSLAWGAKAANVIGAAQAAVLCSLFYGLIDIFGFSGTIKIAIAMLRKSKGVSSNAKGNENSQNSGLPKHPPQV